MSYVGLKSDDLMLNMLHDDVMFFRLLPHMEQARDENNFDTWLIWFEKLKLIDKRLLIRYMRKEKDNYPEQWVYYANRMLQYRLYPKSEESR